VCGRYSLAIDDFSELRLGVTLSLFPESWTRRYNIAPSPAPGHEVPIIRRLGERRGEGQAEVQRARWWLIPHWWTGPLAKLPTSFNARSEDIQQKPLWREPFAQRRCLVPATGWREFVAASGPKRAYHFQRNEPFAFAGLWDRVVVDGAVIDSFAIVTAEASPLVLPIHDRMPLVLPKELHERWLFADGEARTVLDEAIPRRDEQLELFEVSTYGNSVHHEGPACIARVATQTELFANEAREAKPRVN
jgi:putative SOS response-associated peptidase YedK